MGSMDIGLVSELPSSMPEQLVMSDIEDAANRDFAQREHAVLSAAGLLIQSELDKTRFEMPTGLRAFLFERHERSASKRQIRRLDLAMRGIDFLQRDISAVANGEKSANGYVQTRCIPVAGFDLDYFLSEAERLLDNVTEPTPRQAR